MSEPAERPKARNGRGRSPNRPRKAGDVDGVDEWGQPMTFQVPPAIADILRGVLNPNRRNMRSRGRARGGNRNSRQPNNRNSRKGKHGKCNAKKAEWRESERKKRESRKNEEEEENEQDEVDEELRELRAELDKAEAEEQRRENEPEENQQQNNEVNNLPSPVPMVLPNRQMPREINLQRLLASQGLNHGTLPSFVGDLMRRLNLNYDDLNAMMNRPVGMNAQSEEEEEPEEQRMENEPEEQNNENNVPASVPMVVPNLAAIPDLIRQRVTIARRQNEVIPAWVLDMLGALNINVEDLEDAPREEEQQDDEEPAVEERELSERELQRKKRIEMHNKRNKSPGGKKMKNKRGKSPKGRRESPKRRDNSPTSRNELPKKRGKSPKARDQSPAEREESPKGRGKGCNSGGRWQGRGFGNRGHHGHGGHWARQWGNRNGPFELELEMTLTHKDDEAPAAEQEENEDVNVQDQEEDVNDVVQQQPELESLPPAPVPVGEFGEMSQEELVLLFEAMKSEMQKRENA